MFCALVIIKYIFHGPTETLSESFLVDQAHHVCDSSFGEFGKDPASPHDPEVCFQITIAKIF